MRLMLAVLAMAVAGCGPMPVEQWAPDAATPVECADNQCAIAGKCWVWEERNPDNECQVCHVKFSRTRWYDLRDCRPTG